MFDCGRSSADPPKRAIGYQTWHDLLFLHWSVPPEAVSGLLPAEVTLDTWEGRA